MSHFFPLVILGSAALYAAYSVETLSRFYVHMIGTMHNELHSIPSISPYELGGYAGFSSAVGSMAIFLLAKRFIRTSASSAYRTLTKALFSSSQLSNRLGEDFRSKTIYRMTKYGRNVLYDNPSFTSAREAAPVIAPRIRYVSVIPSKLTYRPHFNNWPRYWASTRFHFILYVEGSKDHGLVSAEIEQNIWGQNRINFCVLDLVSKGEQFTVKLDVETMTDPRKSNRLLTDYEDEIAGTGKHSLVQPMGQQ